MSRWTICALAAAVSGIVLASDIPPPRPVDVAALVRQLGSDDFAKREEASRRLATLKVDAPPPELLAALKSTNPEVRDRARRAVKALEAHIVRERERVATARLPRSSFVRNGGDLVPLASPAGGHHHGLRWGRPG
jgi:hypothetical protein